MLLVLCFALVFTGCKKKQERTPDVLEMEDLRGSQPDANNPDTDGDGIVEKDGEVTHPYFILDRNPLGKNPFFRKAVLEIIKKMPKWKPGLRNGKAVRSYYTIPIMFKLK